MPTVSQKPISASVFWRSMRRWRSSMSLASISRRKFITSAMP